ncbi:unnamed protein product, partial [Ectocarpus fasciculatus]
GSIPTWLGFLSTLEKLRLSGNQLVGHVPKELGDLENLQWLSLQNNHLTGAIPTELASLSALSSFGYGNNPPQSIWRRRKQLTGGPAKREGLDSWRAR